MKREVKAWAVVNERRPGKMPTTGLGGCCPVFWRESGAEQFVSRHEKIVRCTITWDDGQPETEEESDADS